MIIAVTGSEGFVGKKLVENLKQENYQVIEIDLSKGIDITKKADCETIPYFDTLIHLAARSYVPDSYIYPSDFYYINFIGTLNMLELCRKYNSRFVFTSSYVYGNPQYLPIDEKHPLMAFNPYADSKIKGEELCKSYQTFFNVKTIIIRPFNIFGNGQNDNFLISSIIKQSKSGIIQLQDSRPKRDYIYIDDVVAAFKLSAIINLEGFNIFNIGSGISYSVKQVTDIINSLHSGKLKINFSEKPRPNEVLDTVADISNAKRLLDWFPKISIEKGLEKIFYEK